MGANVNVVDELDLADWRAQVASMYLSDVDLAGFRARRDGMFATHPQSPIPAAQRAAFTGLRYFPDNPSAIVEAELTPATGSLDIDTGGPDGRYAQEAADGSRAEVRAPQGRVKHMPPTVRTVPGRVPGTTRRWS